MPVRAVVFDVEGTLFKSKSLTDAYRDQVLRLLSEKKGLSGESLISELRRVMEELRREGYVERPPSTLIAEKLGVTREEFYGAIDKVDPAEHVAPDPELASTLREMKNSFKLAVLTNLSRKGLRGVFSALGLGEELFDVVLTADDLDLLKPHPSAFKKVLESLGVKPEEAVMVGDMVESDLAPAKELGMKTILVSDKPADSPHVDLTVKRAAEIKDRIRLLQ
ncbi:MAG: HAD family hydrolase [Candidatus Freyarchaeota archaeon]|nr:HAD family hydrolase [Candidatus Freyrarchaeum guaymaensis]